MHLVALKPADYNGKNRLQNPAERVDTTTREITILKYLHAMIRVRDLDRSLSFYRDGLGLREVRRRDYESGRFTLVYLATEEGAPEIELTYNWDQKESYGNGRNFGHLAFLVDDIYKTCERLQSAGVTILRPPRDGRMAFVKCPDEISIEFLQKGDSLTVQEPWSSMENIGSW